MKQALTVKGMHCPSCATLVKEALEDAGASQVAVSVDERRRIGTVRLDTTLSRKQLAAIIADQGDYVLQ